MFETTYQAQALNSGYGHRQVDTEALRLYRQATVTNWPSRIWLTMIGQSARLQDLTAAEIQASSHTGHYAGVQTVPIAKIRGSEGRTTDFDARFRPRSEHNRDRWLSVAKARLNDIPLPRVMLIQVGDSYFVRDGHHRISVARTLGEAYIDAEVVVWHIDEPADRA